MVHDAQPDEKLIERIRKLYAKAESAKAIGSEAEAAAFYAGVQKMLLKHKLDAAILTFEEKERVDPLEREWVDWKVYGVDQKRKRIAWIENLAASVAAAHFCRMVVMSKTNNIMLVGRSTDRQVATFVLGRLVRQGEELAEAGYWRERYKSQKQGHYTTGGYKSAFLYGYVQRIKERYAEVQRAQLAEPGTALVIRKSMDEVTKYMSEMSGLRNSRRPTDRVGNNEGARAQGREAGSKANLRADGLGGGTRNGSALGAGQRQLGAG